MTVQPRDPVVTGYQPGACNIGTRQGRARLLAGLGSFAVAGAVLAGVALSVLPRSGLWATAPLVFGGWIGVLQARSRFCVVFGALARYDLSDAGGSSGRVDEPAAVRADRRRAVVLLGYAFGLTLVTMGVVLALTGTA